MHVICLWCIRESRRSNTKSDDRLNECNPPENQKKVRKAIKNNAKVPIHLYRSSPNPKRSITLIKRGILHSHRTLHRQMFDPTSYHFPFTTVTGLSPLFLFSRLSNSSLNNSSSWVLNPLTFRVSSTNKLAMRGCSGPTGTTPVVSLMTSNISLISLPSSRYVRNEWSDHAGNVVLSEELGGLISMSFSGRGAGLKSRGKEDAEVASVASSSDMLCAVRMLDFSGCESGRLFSGLGVEIGELVS